MIVGGVGIIDSIDDALSIYNPRFSGVKIRCGVSWLPESTPGRRPKRQSVTPRRET